MATQDFVKFYSEYLPQHSDLKKKIDAITNEQAFTKAVLESGPKAGFHFSEADVIQVMKASEQKVLGANAELSDAQLEGVAGGAGGGFSAPTVQLGTLSMTNVSNRLQLPNLGSEGTIMCCW